MKMEKAQQRVVLRGEERGGKGKGGVRERGKGREERKGAEGWRVGEEGKREGRERSHIM